MSNHDPILGETEREFQVLMCQWIFSGFLGIAVLRWFYCEFFLNLVVTRGRHYYATWLWLSKTDKSIRDGKKEEEVDWKKIHIENTAYYPIMYAFLALLCLGFLGAVNSDTIVVYDLTDKNLFLRNMPVLAYQV